MVAHQAIRPDLHAEPRHGQAGHLQAEPPVVAREKHLRTQFSQVHHVVRKSRKYNVHLPSHGTKLVPKRISSQDQTISAGGIS